MHFLTANSDAHYASSKDAFSKLEDIFAGDWQNREDEIASCMNYLRGKKRLLTEWTLRTLQSDTRPEMIGAQSFLVHQSRSFICRINLWFPQGSLGMASDSYRRYLSIEVLHNHDFNFYTTCLHGGGYTSRFFICSNGLADLEIDDRIAVDREEMVHLEGEKIIFVERGYDFHTQYWPADFSITLNVIPIEKLSNRQYSVNPDSMRVKFVVNARQNLKHKLYTD